MKNPSWFLALLMHSFFSPPASAGEIIGRGTEIEILAPIELSYFAQTEVLAKYRMGDPAENATQGVEACIFSVIHRSLVEGSSLTITPGKTLVVASNSDGVFITLSGAGARVHLECRSAGGRPLELTQELLEKHLGSAVRFVSVIQLEKKLERAREPIVQQIRSSPFELPREVSLGI